MPLQELTNFRQKYPDYGDMDDVTLATKLAAKFPDAYGDLPSRVQGSEQPSVTESGSGGQPTPEPPGYWSKMGTKIVDTSKRVWNDLTAPQTPDGMPVTPLRPALRIAGGIGEIANAAVDNLIPEGTGAAVGKWFSDRMDPWERQQWEQGTKPTLRSAAQAVTGAWDKLKEVSPEGAQDLKDLYNIAGAAGTAQIVRGAGRMAGKAGEALAESATGQAIKSTAASAAGKAAFDLESSANRALLKDALDAILPEGKAIIGARKTTTSPILKKVEAVPTARDIEIGSEIKDTLRKGMSPTESVEALDSRVGELESAKKTLVSKYPEPINPTELESRLAVARDSHARDALFTGGTTAEKEYDGIVQIARNLLEDKPLTPANLLDVRQALDAKVKKLFPRIEEKLPEYNVRAQAWKGVRDAINDTIAESIPEGDKFRSLLRSQTNILNASESIQDKIKAADMLGMKQRLVNLMTRHPWLTLGALEGTGLGTAVVTSLTNPIALMALASYGVYKAGKLTITAPEVRQGLARFLRGAEKVLTPAEKGAVENVMAQIGGPGPRRLITGPEGGPPPLPGGAAPKALPPGSQDWTPGERWPITSQGESVPFPNPKVGMPLTMPQEGTSVSKPAFPMAPEQVPPTGRVEAVMGNWQAANPDIELPQATPPTDLRQALEQVGRVSPARTVGSGEKPYIPVTRPGTPNTGTFNVREQGRMKELLGSNSPEQAPPVTSKPTLRVVTKAAKSGTRMEQQGSSAATGSVPPTLPPQGTQAATSSASTSPTAIQAGPVPTKDDIVMAIQDKKSGNIFYAGTHGMSAAKAEDMGVKFKDMIEGYVLKADPYTFYRGKPPSK